MSEATAQQTKKTTVAPFGVEADTPRNQNVMLQSIPNCVLRGALNASKTARDAQSGEERVPRDQARHLGVLPPTPGQQIHVNPQDGTYTIIDPLHGDEEMCEKIRRGLKGDGRPVPERIDGHKPQKGQLDKHRMKTLCRELINMLESDEVKMVKGPRPKLEDVERLPGDFLLNPGSRVHNTQPTFEKDWDEWVQQLTRSGG